MTRQNRIHRGVRIYEQERKKYMRQCEKYYIGYRRRIWGKAWWRAWKKQIERGVNE